MSNYDLIRTYSPDQNLVLEKREHIVRCAYEIFIKNGYHGTNLRAIMDACGMGAGTLYHYIGSKEDILYLVMVSSVERVQKRLDELNKRCKGLNVKESLSETIKELIKINDDEQDSVIMNIREIKNISRRARQALLDGVMNNTLFLESILKNGVKSGEFEIEDTFFVAHRVHELVEAWALQRWYLRTRYSMDQYTELVIHDTYLAIKAIS